MNKPCGFVCSAASDSHKTVYELLTPELQKMVSEAPRGCRLHTVGRLDCDTSGLLLITNDGNFSHKITTNMVIECPQSGCIEITIEHVTTEVHGGFDTIASQSLNHQSSASW